MKAYLIEHSHPMYSMDRKYVLKKDKALQDFEDKLEEIKKEYNVVSVGKPIDERLVDNDNIIKSVLIITCERCSYEYEEYDDQYYHLDIEEIEIEE